MTILTAWCRKHWKHIVVVFVLVALGMVLGVQMQGCRRTVTADVPTTTKDTTVLLDEAYDLLREIQRRQTERQRAAEGLK